MTVDHALPEIARAESIDSAVHMAIGAASACWDNLSGAGTYQSDEALRIAAALLERIRRVDDIAPGVRVIERGGAQSGTVLATAETPPTQDHVLVLWDGGQMLWAERFLLIAPPL